MQEIKLINVIKASELFSEVKLTENVDVFHEVKPKSPKLIKIIVGRQNVSPTFNNILKSNDTVVRMILENGNGILGSSVSYFSVYILYLI
jgi:hypothetical protein